MPDVRAFPRFARPGLGRLRALVRFGPPRPLWILKKDGRERSCYLLTDPLRGIQSRVQVVENDSVVAFEQCDSDLAALKLVTAIRDDHERAA